MLWRIVISKIIGIVGRGPRRNWDTWEGSAKSGALPPKAGQTGLELLREAMDELLERHSGLPKHKRKNRQTAGTGDFGRPLERCVLHGGLRPPARRIPARTIQSRRPEAARRASSSRQGSNWAPRDALSCLVGARWAFMEVIGLRGVPFCVFSSRHGDNGLQGMSFLCPTGDRWGPCK